MTENLPDIDPDFKSYTFHLRKNITFSDGKPMTTADILFSFKSIMNPFVDSAPVRADLHNFSDCIAVDDYTVVFKLKAGGPKNLDKLAINFFILPKHIYDPDHVTDGYSTASRLSQAIIPSAAE